MSYKEQNITKKNVTYATHSHPVIVLREYSNSTNLSDVAELSASLNSLRRRSSSGRERKIHRRVRHKTLKLSTSHCRRPWQRNVPEYITHVQSHCCAHQSLLLCDVLVAVTVSFSQLPNNCYFTGIIELYTFGPGSPIGPLEPLLPGGPCKKMNDRNTPGLLKQSRQLQNSKAII